MTSLGRSNRLLFQSLREHQDNRGGDTDGWESDEVLSETNSLVLKVDETLPRCSECSLIDLGKMITQDGGVKFSMKLDRELSSARSRDVTCPLCAFIRNELLFYFQKFPMMRGHRKWDDEKKEWKWELLDYTILEFRLISSRQPIDNATLSADAILWLSSHGITRVPEARSQLPSLVSLQASKIGLLHMDKFAHEREPKRTFALAADEGINVPRA